jgi:hypothetical protein
MADADGEAARVTAEAAERAASIASAGRARAAATRRAVADEVIASARVEGERIERTTAEAVRARQQPAEAEVRALVGEAVRLVMSIQPDATSAYSGRA